jgi:hypothetical protein
MENLTPPLLRALRELKWLMTSGKSMTEAFQIYLSRADDDLASRLRQLWILKNQSSRAPFTPESLPTYLQRTFWELIERGARGEPCLEALNTLEREVEKAAQAELDEHLAALPFKVLMPLLLFQFPAYLLLLLGPLLRELQRQLGG